MRIAVTQFATSQNTQENLASCIRLINEAASCKPALIVLPNFCNTQPYYADHNEAWQQALSLDGDFIGAIAVQAKKHTCYIVLNVTLQRDLTRDDKIASGKSNISITTCLFSPSGELIHQADKQALSKHEQQFFSTTNNKINTIKTSLAKLGFLAGTDSTDFKLSRALAFENAQLLCHSTSTDTLDESHLHNLARACENNVFIASANKVGPLYPDNKANLENSVLSEGIATGIGHSQIISPSGQVLASIESTDEGFTFADLDAVSDHLTATYLANDITTKLRPDGTRLIEQLRPELYQALTEAITKTDLHEIKEVPLTANVAIFATYTAYEKALEDVCHYIENNLSDIIQLPELFFISDKSALHNAEERAVVAEFSKRTIYEISKVLRPFQYVCTSLIIDNTHQAVLINKEGLFAKQGQLHRCNRYQWVTLVDDFTTVKLPLEQGNVTVAMLTADDANIPEMITIVSLHQVHVLLVPFDIQEPCETDVSLFAQAAENRLCIVAATREKNFVKAAPIDNSDNIYKKNKVKTHKSTGVIINLTVEPALLTQWKSPKFSGYSNQPLVKHQQGKITKAVIHPIAACNKLIIK